MSATGVTVYTTSTCPWCDRVKDFLTKHPDVRGVFWGKGGSTGLRRQLYPMQEKFLGTFIQDNIYDLESQMSTYPGDVWQLAEEQLLEPLVYVDRVEITQDLPPSVIPIDRGAVGDLHGLVSA